MDRRAAGLLALAVALLIGAAVFNGGSGGGSDDETSSGSYRPPATTTTTTAVAATTTAPEVTQATVVDDDFEGAEAANEGRDETSNGPDYDGPGEPITFDHVDRADPQSVASGWGCAYQAAPFGETADARMFRMNAMTTQKAAAKLATLSSFDADVDTKSYLIAATDSGDGLYRVHCAIKIRTEAGKLVGEDLTSVVWVRVINEEGIWSVDDFAQGGIGLAP